MKRSQNTYHEKTIPGLREWSFCREKKMERHRERRQRDYGNLKKDLIRFKTTGGEKTK